MLSLLVAPSFRLAQLLEPYRASSVEQCPYTLWSCFCLSIVTFPWLLIPLLLLPAQVELGGIVPQHGNVQLSMQGVLRTLEVENISMNPQEQRGECFCMVVVFA